ncbi:MAG: MarR family winged helix-turn-helix transcriptional regulator [Burkholderiaceae bacterium]
MRTPSIDLETRAESSDHAALRLWLRLLTCTNLVEHSIRARLRADFGSTLPRFDLLAQLERVPDGLRMSELSQRMMVTGGNITALTEQLQSEGLIERTSDPVDRRVTRVSLTQIGRRRFSEMASAHQHWVGELTESLGPDDARQLFELLGKLKLSVQSAQTDEAKTQ